MRRPRRRTALWIAAAAVVAAALFAPLIGYGYCAVAPLSGASSCATAYRSIVGLDTSLWLWLGATVVLDAIVWWLASRKSRRER